MYSIRQCATAHQLAVHAQRGIVLANLSSVRLSDRPSIRLSDRLSVYLSNAGTESKRMDRSSNFLIF